MQFADIRADRTSWHWRIRRRVARRVSMNIFVYVLAACFEIAGCFAFWLWIRRTAPFYVAVLGIVSLIGFALALTRVDSAFAGRAYAAYGGIYIAASLVWLWLAEQQRPTMTDLVGAGIAIIGALVIIGFAPKAP
jgi:small multidrug resistance family-3 protein